MTATTQSTGRSTTDRGPLMFSPTYLRLDVRRSLRNRRTLIFLLVMPVAFFFLFGGQYRSSDPEAYSYVMISMAVYGAMIATTSMGAQVSVERSLGWTRQLRLTPLRPAGYVLTKIAAALLLGIVPIVVVLGIGAISGAHLDNGWTWLQVGVLSWICSLVFAAFGLFVGYLVPAENAMQFIGPLLALMSFFGGLFFPLDKGSTLAHIAPYMPTYAIGYISRSPLEHSGLTVLHLADLLLWVAVFGIGTAILFRRDTQRV